MYVTSKEQRKAIHALWQRYKNGALENGNFDFLSYRNFRKQGRPELGWGVNAAILFPLWNMWIGIERDGYTHS